MFPQHVGGSLGFCDPESEACGRQARLGSFERTLDAFFHTFGNGILDLFGRGLFLPQAADTLLPFVKFRIAEHGVLDDCIPLILRLTCAGLPLGSCRFEKFAQRRIENRRLGRRIEDCGRRAFQAKRVSPGFSQPRAHGDLWNIIVMELAITLERALFVGGSNRGQRAMAEGQFDHALQRDRLRAGADREAEAQADKEPAQTNTVAIDHCVTLGTGKSEKPENTNRAMSAKDSQMRGTRGTKFGRTLPAQFGDGAGLTGLAIGNALLAAGFIG